MKSPLFLKKPAVKYSALGFVSSGVLAGLYFIFVPVFHEFKDSFAMKEFKQYGVYGTYKKHFFSAIDHFDELASLEVENEMLNQKVAKLEESKVLREHHEVEREVASSHAATENEIKVETGSKEALTLDAIAYTLPTNLTLAQLHALGVGYFKAKDYEKSVVIFHYLTHLKEDPSFKMAANYLMEGIAWYHLKNYHLAESLFETAKQNSSHADALHRQAFIWAVMCKKKLGKEKQVQTALLQFISEFPHSNEATVINSTTHRKPAREMQEGPALRFKHDPHEAEEQVRPEAEAVATPDHHAVQEKGAHDEHH